MKNKCIWYLKYDNKDYCFNQKVDSVDKCGKQCPYFDEKQIEFDIWKIVGNGYIGTDQEFLDGYPITEEYYELDINFDQEEELSFLLCQEKFKNCEFDIAIRVRKRGSNG